MRPDLQIDYIVAQQLGENLSSVLLGSGFTAALAYQINLLGGDLFINSSASKTGWRAPLRASQDLAYQVNINTLQHYWFSDQTQSFRTANDGLCTQND